VPGVREERAGGGFDQGGHNRADERVQALPRRSALPPPPSLERKKRRRVEGNSRRRSPHGLARWQRSQAKLDITRRRSTKCPPAPALASELACQTGRYSVNPDCTGFQEIDLNVPKVPPGTSHGVIHNAFVISNGGRSIHGVVAEITSPGATSPAASLTRVDFWKVASERDE
jgi:hypothetical protein